MQTWFIVELVTLALSLPVLALSYYWMVLLVSSTKYPRKLGRKKVELDYHPMVSILIATFNERFVIEKSLDAVERLDYPRHKIQVVVADDSNDLTAEIIEKKVWELKSFRHKGDCFEKAYSGEFQVRCSKQSYGLRGWRVRFAA